MSKNMNLKFEKKDIDLIVYDFDGVMTDNKVLLFDNGTEAVVVNRADGLAVSIICALNIPQIIISTERNEVVRERAKKLNIPVINNVKNKKVCLTDYCKQNNFRLDKTVYIGNDINDLEVMKTVGFPLCPADADARIKKIARYVFLKSEGEGVIREFADLFIENDYS